MRFFVIRGFGVKKDSGGTQVDFDRVDRELIAPALAQCGHVGGTTGQIVDAGNIRADMFALILEADIVICDITVHNANVFYELGVRHALRKKHTVLIKSDPSADSTPFDLSTDRYLKYPVASPCEAVDALVAAIKAGVNGNRVTDGPIFLLLPSLAEANTAQVCVCRSTSSKRWSRQKRRPTTAGCACLLKTCVRSGSNGTGRRPWGGHSGA